MQYVSILLINTSSNVLLHNSISKRNLLVYTIIAFVYSIFCVASVVMQQTWILLVPIALTLCIATVVDIRIPFFLLMGTLVISINGQEKLHANIDFPDEILMLFTTFVFLFLIAKRWHTIKENFKHPLLYVIFGIYIWSVIATIFSKDVVMSLKFILKKIWYLSPFLGMAILLFKTKKNIITTYRLLFIPLFFVVITVLVKYNKLGFRFEDVHDPIQPFFINHVMYGSMVSCLFPAIVCSVALLRKWSISWFFVLFSIPVFLVAIYFSYSRAAWMSVLFAAGAYVCIRYKIMHYAMLLFYVLVFSFITWLATNNNYLSYRPLKDKTVMHETLSDHIMATIQGTDISSAERYYRWIASLRMCKYNLMTGVGPNNFYTNYKPYTISSFQTWVSRNPEKSTTHNYFLLMLVEQGVPAMLLYAFFILCFFYYGQKIYHKQQERFYKVVAMSVMLVMSAIFINNFFCDLLETNKVGSLFFMCIAILVAIDNKTTKYHL